MAAGCFHPLRRRLNDALQFAAPDPFLHVLDGEFDCFSDDDPGDEYGFVSEMNNTGAAFGYGLHDADHDFLRL
jgi:hypothetical protein